MGKLNNPIASQLQLSSFGEMVEQSLRSKDLNFMGVDASKLKMIAPELRKSPFEVCDDEATINKVLLWMQLKKDDNGRYSGPCGIVYEMLGKIGNDANLNKWEESITNAFNDYFKDLSLAYIKISMRQATKTVVIDMIVFDKHSKSNTEIRTEGQYD